MWRRQRFSSEEEALVQALAAGHTLKDHRFLDGRKQHTLHRLDGTTFQVGAAVVDRLRREGVIASNKKFPAATYLLTEKGRRLVARLGDGEGRSLTARHDRSTPPT
jgi:hypothetical protein